MGGRAFENLVRIKREDINPTLTYLANVLNFPGLDTEYMTKNLMGSCGKQADSGDLDIAMADKDFDKWVLYRLAKCCRKNLGSNQTHALEYNPNQKHFEFVRSQGLKADQLNIAVPINGDPTKGYVQVDFIYGNEEWLKFAHWSPGKDRSPYKGVFISQAMGVLAKMKVLWRYPEDAKVDKDAKVDERLAEVAFAYNLERGLRVRCRLYHKKNGSFGEVEADTFETKCPVVPPHVPRLGYVSDPETVVRLLVGKGVTPSDVETFEDFLAAVKRARNEEEWEMFKERLVNSLMRSAAKREMTEKEMWDLLNRL